MDLCQYGFLVFIKMKHTYHDCIFFPNLISQRRAGTFSDTHCHLCPALAQIRNYGKGKTNKINIAHKHTNTIFLATGYNIWTTVFILAKTFNKSRAASCIRDCIVFTIPDVNFAIHVIMHATQWDNISEA